MVALRIKNIDTYGWEAAIRGMRNSRLSHDASDSIFTYKGEEIDGVTQIMPVVELGERDLKLASDLCRRGASDRKFLRMIHFTADITAGMSFWHDFDTYKVGTVVNSESRIAWLAKNEITAEKLGLDKNDKLINSYVILLNVIRKAWIYETDPEQKKYHWNLLTRMIPAGYSQLRTVDLTYETLFAIYRDRRNHPLDEFQAFCGMIETLPYAKEFIVDPILGGKKNDYQ